MDCKMVQQKIFKFIYGESDPDELRLINAHLERCGDCRAERELIADILEQLKRGMPDDPVPQGFKERVLERIHAISDTSP
jgi:anti-sigma factor (TIGR02949 family)